MIEGPLWTRAVLSAVVTIGVLGGAEATLRALDFSDSGLYAGDPGWHWTLRPGLDLAQVDHLEEGTVFSVQTSAEGLRDGAWPTEGPSVLALGCSTTFGWGVAAADAWPEQLESRLGVPVINAGVPGHSSHQGRRFAEDWLARAPSVALLGWGVRDAQRSSIADLQARPARFPRSTHLFRLLRSWLPRAGGSTLAESVFRVSPAAFKQNTRAVAESAQEHGVRVILLDFPSQNPSLSHQQVLRELSGELGVVLLTPSLPGGAFFENDSIHLTVEGNRRLGELLMAPVQTALSESG